MAMPRPIARRLASRRRRERGQVLILFVGFFSVIMIVGAIVVDFGLAFSERRGAQRDADLVALAGAHELAVLNAGAAEATAAQAAVAEWAALNNIGNSSVTNVKVDDTCYNSGTSRAGIPDAVSVDVNHDTSALFSKFLGFDLLKIGAHAKACAGAAQSPKNLVPVEVDQLGDCFDPSGSRRPVFTQLCPLKFAAHGDPTNPNRAPRGLLRLFPSGNQCSSTTAGGASTVTALIRDGSQALCLINVKQPQSCDPVNIGPWTDCVAIKNGELGNEILKGFHERIAKETQPPFVGGPCDPDTFQNAVTAVTKTGSDPTTWLYAPTDCVPSTPGVQLSPRLITIFVLASPPGSRASAGIPVVAFAEFWVAGCLPETDPAPTDLNWMNSCPLSAQPGHELVYGRFVNLIVTNAGTGPVTNSTTLFSISLNQ